MWRVVLEFGARLRLLMLAQVAAILPKRENDLVRLQMDAIGVIDFDQGTAALDATLLRFAAAEEVRADRRYGDAAEVGGLAEFRAGRRRIASGLQPAAQLSQAGTHRHQPRRRRQPAHSLRSLFRADRQHRAVRRARRAVRVGAGFSIQGEIGFDVLIQFDPFSFLAEFHAQLQLKRGSTNLFKVRVEGALAGPRPLHIKGKATFEILWWDVSIRIDKTLVEGEKPPLPEPIDVLPRLKEALGNPGNWVSQLPDGQRPMVTLRAETGAADRCVAPSARHADGQTECRAAEHGYLQVRPGRARRSAPLHDHAASASADRARRREPVKDFFAPAQFFEMSDDEKLSRPSFEPMAAGVGFGSDEFAFTAERRRLAGSRSDRIRNHDRGQGDERIAAQRSEQPKDLYHIERRSCLASRPGSAPPAAAKFVARGKAKYRTTMGKHGLPKKVGASSRPTT